MKSKVFNLPLSCYLFDCWKPTLKLKKEHKRILTATHYFFSLEFLKQLTEEWNAGTVKTQMKD